MYVYYELFLTALDADVSLFVSKYSGGTFNSKLFDKHLERHDAFVIVDRYIFVQVQFQVWLHIICVQRERIRQHALYI